MTPEEIAKLARKCASAVAKVEGPSSYYERMLPILTVHLAAREEECARLREAVEKHHRQRGNDKCWECDNELYVAFGLEPHSATDLPPIEEHRRNCEAYRCRLYEAALTPQQEQGSVQLPDVP